MSFDPQKVQRFKFDSETGWMEDLETGQVNLPEEEFGSLPDYVHASDYDQLLSLLHEVATEADPAGTLRENIALKETVKALEIENEELKAEIERLRK